MRGWVSAAAAAAAVAAVWVLLARRPAGPAAGGERPPAAELDLEVQLLERQARVAAAALEAFEARPLPRPRAPLDGAPLPSVGRASGDGGHGGTLVTGAAGSSPRPPPALFTSHKARPAARQAPAIPRVAPACIQSRADAIAACTGG